MDSVSHTPRARIRHQCDCCHGTIWPGETCTDCDQLTNRVWYWVRPDEGITDVDYEDWARSYSTTAEARAYLHRIEYGRPDPTGEGA